MIARTSRRASSVLGTRKKLTESTTSQKAVSLFLAGVSSRGEESIFPVFLGAGILLAGLGIGFDEIGHSSTKLEATVTAPPVASSDTDADDQTDETTLVINWSGTHAVTVKNENYWEPETIGEVEDIVRVCHDKGQAVRPLGSSLSPNGIALNGAGMISMANLDQVIAIDQENMTVTVQAGITVNNVSKSIHARGRTIRIYGVVSMWYGTIVLISGETAVPRST
jgi:hypothetical protein